MDLLIKPMSPRISYISPTSPNHSKNILFSQTFNTKSTTNNNLNTKMENNNINSNNNVGIRYRKSGTGTNFYNSNNKISLNVNEEIYNTNTNNNNYYATQNLHRDSNTLSPLNMDSPAGIIYSPNCEHFQKRKNA